ncbi:serine/threonine protein kinase [Pyxidicoccus fallax]|uniref:Serine/threonine protein kinase n=1 Tax=Pyxidicoccus fallax TaxID=394095 RepID=A0A848LRN5_9BACT|nr:serine/threonine-protein kinase [Pyxidicoccus fallax]NMO20585.1 serine/threonine protein kinase [Pyxidicoccus fallax]NPC85651.1 serine/threonine protein kinase [Pyxidicoccus fallax]
MSSPPSDVPPPPQVLLRSGRTSYEFVRSLGPAHHGELVLARRRYEWGFGGYAVLKRPLRAGDEASRRLLEEGRLTAQLNHPNIVAVHHLKGSDEAPVLVFEHTPGHRLDALLEASTRAQLPISEAFALYIASEVADALHHAHNLTDEHGRALQVVHRDVGPHNILVTEHGAVKLLDFGAAWSRLPGRVTTTDSELPGSLAYAAPEHVAQLGLDGRADQFSLGIVLLQLLTGRHLFEGADRFEAERRRRREHTLAQDSSTREHALAAAMHEAVSHAAQNELRQRILGYGEAELAEATRAVSAALVPLLHKALAPDRVERFATCADLARALREHLRRTGQSFGRPEALAELAGLRYAALRVQAGESPEEALEDRLLPEDDLAS